MDVLSATNEIGEWAINGIKGFAYSPAVVSDSVPFYTITKIDSLFELGTLATFHLPIWSSLVAQPKIAYPKGVVFVVPPRRPDQHPITFWRVESWSDPNLGDDNDSQASPQFELYEPNFHKMMRKIGYDLTSKQGLNFGKGRRNLLRSFVPKGKN